MRENKKFALLYIAITAVVASVAAIFQYILTENYLENGVGLYKIGVVTPNAFYIYMTMAALLIVTAAFVMRLDALPTEIKGGSAWTCVFSVLCAILIVFSSIVFFMENNLASLLGSSSLVANRFRIAVSLIAFPAAIYYFLVSFSGNSKSKALPALSFFPLIWTLIYLMSVYFDHSVLINSPIRIIQQLALIILMLYQLCEIRAYIGIAKPAMYFILSLLATVFLAAAFFPGAIEVISGAKKIASDTVYYLYGSATAFYAFSRAVDFALECPLYGSRKIVRPATPATDDYSSFIDEISESMDEIPEEADELNDEINQISGENDGVSPSRVESPEPVDVEPDASCFFAETTDENFKKPDVFQKAVEERNRLNGDFRGSADENRKQNDFPFDQEKL